MFCEPVANDLPARGPAGGKDAESASHIRPADYKSSADSCTSPRRTLNWIRDNGIGISHEAQAKLFRSYTQLGPVRVPGHGLGLSIVRSIVEKLGGQVSVETEVGTGSQLFFTLPTQW